MDTLTSRRGSPFVVEKGPDVADAVPPMERPAGAADRRAVPSWAIGAMDESGAPPLVGLDAAGRVVQMNQACADLAGQTTAQAAGRPGRDVLTCLDSELDESRWAARRKDGTGPPPTEQISIDATGNRRRLRWTYVAVPPSADLPAHILGTGVDISRERLAEISSRTPSETDPLTNVGNRAVFQASVAEHADPGTGLGCGVVLCELDGLEVINDSYGHAAVNAVLIQIASRLRTTVRDSDLIARIGDHTFAVVLSALGMLQTRAVAVRLERCIRLPLRLPNGLVKLNASIGLAVLTPGDDPDATVSTAHAAICAATSRRTATRHRLAEPTTLARPLTKSEGRPARPSSRNAGRGLASISHPRNQRDADPRC